MTHVIQIKIVISQLIKASKNIRNHYVVSVIDITKTSTYQEVRWRKLSLDSKVSTAIRPALHVGS